PRIRLIGSPHRQRCRLHRLPCHPAPRRINDLVVEQPLAWFLSTAEHCLPTALATFGDAPPPLLPRSWRAMRSLLPARERRARSLGVCLTVIPPPRRRNSVRASSRTRGSG